MLQLSAFAGVKTAYALMNLRDRKLIFVVGLVLLLNALLEAVGIGLIFPFIKLVSDPASISEFPIIYDFKAALGIASDQSFLFLAAFCLVALFTFKNAFLFASNVWQEWYLRRTESEVSRNLMNRYLRANYNLYFLRHSAELIRNMLDCVPSTYTGLLLNMIRATTEFFVAIAVVAALFIVDARTATVVSISLGGSAGLFYVVLRTRIEYWAHQQLLRSKDRLQAATEILGVAKEIRVLGREAFFSDVFHAIQLNFARTMVRIGALSDMPRLALEVAMVWVIVGAILWHLSGGNNSTDIIASLAVFAAAAFRLLPSANRMLSALNNIRQQMPSVRAVAADFFDPDLEPTVADKDDDVQPLEFENLQLIDVEYRYPNTEIDVLNGVTLTIEKGESVAIVGSSGAGKTTLVDVVLGLLEPTAGRVVVNGSAVRDQLRAWQKSIGYVPQAIYLLDDTLRNNLALGIDRKNVDDMALDTAIRAAHIDAFINTLSKGLDTMIGERGVRLSGGQRQRIGLARAMYLDPEILILDEATSSLDNETERNIAESINALHGKKTLLIIAHRLSTVKNCDRIVFMKEGRIADTGSFEDLMTRNSEFRTLAKLGNLDFATELTSSER